MSFADMLFGGKLTSILVCQKCKHISQTYEDFNDISLSIKPEDYFFGRGSNGRGNKRDKLKKLAKRLTTFPGSGGGSHAIQSPNLNTNPTTTMTTGPGYQATLPSTKIQRPSSVPPSPSRMRAVDGNAQPDNEDDGHSSFVEPRRKSLDLAKTGPVGTMLRVDVDAKTPSSSGGEVDIEVEGVRRAEAGPEEVELSRLEPLEQGNRRKEANAKEDGIDIESDNSNVLIHIISPEEKHVELIEPTEKGKDKKEDVGWARLGRTISIITVGLGKSKDKEKTRSKERDMKRSTERSGLGRVDVTGSTQIQKSACDSGVIEETTGLNMGLDISSKGTLRRSTTAISMSSKEATSASFASNHVAAVPRPMAITSSSSSGSISTAAFNFFKPLPRASSSPSTFTLNSNVAPTVASTSQFHPSQNSKHLKAPSGVHHSPNSRLSLLHNVQRSRSPKPPKPTAAESEYLGKILADVVSSSSGLNSPFPLFKPPTLLLSRAHPFSTSASGLKESSNGGGGVWLGLHHFSGIEECLRLFTAVEVLDGENMVGCRRCWKIANGMRDTKQEEEDDSDQEHEQEEHLDGGMGRHEIHTETNGLINQHQAVLENEGGLKTERPALKVLSIANINGPIHIPTSMSTPTVSFYTQPNSSDSLSVSSLPTEATPVSDVNEDPSLVEFSSKESDNPLRGPGGMLIPTISTTLPSPLDARTSFAGAQHLAAFAKESVVEPVVINGSGDNNRTINAVLSGHGPSINSSSTSALSTTYVTPLSQGLSASNASGSRDSLLIPKVPRRRRTYDSSASPSASTTDNESSDDEESDTSVGTSVSDVSAPARNIPQPKLQGQQQAQAAQQSSLAPQTKPKEKKPKPVIMRPAYKRYLISLPPPVLVIHLKRFQQTSKMPLISFSHGLKKLDDYVSFPEYLDLKPFLAPKKEDYGLGKKKKKKAVVKGKERCMYRLYAVVVHIGNMVSFSIFLLRDDD